jgi:hypothetical protein
VSGTYTDAGGTYARYLAVTTGWFGTKEHVVPVDDVRVEGQDACEFEFNVMDFINDAQARSAFDKRASL